MGNTGDFSGARCVLMLPTLHSGCQGVVVGVSQTETGKEGGPQAGVEPVL